jgi:MbtH protein
VRVPFVLDRDDAFPTGFGVAGARTRSRVASTHAPERFHGSARRRQTVPDPLNSEARRMPMDAEEDTRTYVVLVNHEEQYSLWLAGKDIPLGWTAVGEPGSREACLAYVKEVWTDMTPKSLRRQTQEA